MLPNPTGLHVCFLSLHSGHNKEPGRSRAAASLGARDLILQSSGSVQRGGAPACALQRGVGLAPPAFQVHAVHCHCWRLSVLCVCVCVGSLLSTCTLAWAGFSTVASLCSRQDPPESSQLLDFHSGIMSPPGSPATPTLNALGAQAPQALSIPSPRPQGRAFEVCWSGRQRASRTPCARRLISRHRLRVWGAGQSGSRRLEMGRPCRSLEPPPLPAQGTSVFSPEALTDGTRPSHVLVGDPFYPVSECLD